MDITNYQKKLRALYPTAVIEVSFEEKHIKWDLKFYPPSSEKMHYETFEDIKLIFGDTLMERYTETTGSHFYIFQRYHSQSVEN